MTYDDWLEKFVSEFCMGTMRPGARLALKAMMVALVSQTELETRKAIAETEGTR
jgi:hypothetical protein